MDIVEKTLLKLFISSDDFQFMYDERDVDHGNLKRMSSFYEVVKRELQKSNLFYEELEIKKKWSKIREKFVKINLSKARFVNISKSSDEFYNKWIFMENYISHKHCNVYKTLNKQEILDKVYDEIMENTYSYQDDSLTDESFALDKYEELEILEGYEDIIKENLEAEHKNKKPENEDKENKLCMPKNVLVGEKKDTSNIEKPAIMPKNVLGKTTFSPLTSIMSSLEKVSKTESRFGSLRSKKEQLITSKKLELQNEIVQILNLAILEKTTVQSRALCLKLILKSIKHFCEDNFRKY